MVQQERYYEYDCTEVVPYRLEETWEATTTSRRLAMFQVWFAQNNSRETLHSYNQRLGRPSSEVRRGILSKTKQILKCTKWTEYFNELDIHIPSKKIEHLLRWAVYNSDRKRYHISYNNGYLKELQAPKLQMKSVMMKKMKKMGKKHKKKKGDQHVDDEVKNG